MWADHVCEAPFEQWTVRTRRHAVALDDPADALGRAYGEAAPIALDVEWYATGSPTASWTATSSRASSTASSSFVGGDSSSTRPRPSHAPVVSARRSPRSTCPAAFAHLGLRAPFRFPDGSVLDLVLGPDGWRSRAPRSP